MKDYSSKKRPRLKWESAVGTGLVVLILFFVFVVAVKWFRAPKEEVVVSEIDITNVLTPDPVASHVIEKGIDRDSKDANLFWLGTGEQIGEAARGEKDGKYYLEIESPLPEIDREIYYYQVWLLREIPYDFFSLGEMITDEDGVFIFEWKAPDDELYNDFIQIIITRNLYDGSSEPEDKVIQGEFGI